MSRDDGKRVFRDEDGDELSINVHHGRVVLHHTTEGTDDYDDPGASVGTAHTPDEARAIAQLLIDMADKADG